MSTHGLFLRLYAALALAGIIFGGIAVQYMTVLDCDGYGTYCPYPVDYAKKPFVLNEIEKDTARRAARVYDNIINRPGKYPDRLARGE